MNNPNTYQLTPNELNVRFIKFIQAEFSNVKLNLVPTRHRTSVYVPNKHRNKRWMQVDIQANSLSIVMDHVRGEMNDDDLLKLGIRIGVNNKNRTVQFNSNNDHVKLTVFTHEPFDFESPDFISFLKKHFASYLRRVDVAGF